MSDFYIGKYEVTFDEYDAFCLATNIEKPEDENWGRGRRPVIHVSWHDAVKYCNWRSQVDGLEPVYSGSGETTKCDWMADGYRLPTEAELEYVAHGGQLSEGFKFPGSNMADEVAWYDANSEGMTHPVGEKRANELGLHDISGNVWEWCWDAFDIYPQEKQSDPRGPDERANWISRGGSWNDEEDEVRGVYRNADTDIDHAFDIGFRLSRSSRSPKSWLNISAIPRMGSGTSSSSGEPVG